MAFDLQGHRGARGLAPENTLPSFELALDAGVSTIETDLHLTCDGWVVLFHDAILSTLICQPLEPGVAPFLEKLTLVSDCDLLGLRGFRVVGNPDPARFPTQRARVTPLAQLFAQVHQVDPFAIPTLGDFIQFIQAYAGPLGAQVGKTAQQQERAARVRIDLELKHVPFHPENQGGSFGARLEQELLAIVQATGMVGRTTVRSFDHRAVRALKEWEPRLRGAVLISNTAPIDPARLAKDALAEVYCPDYHFVDEDQVRRAKGQGIQVVPYTVNDSISWERLLGWGVDGITTDYPDQLAAFLRGRGVEVR